MVYVFAAMAVVSALISVYSIMQNKASVDDTNYTNRQIAEDTNAMTKEQNEKNMAFQLQQQQREMAYNSPVAQRQRYEAAGINPYFMLGSGISAGNISAQAAPSAGSYQTGAPQQPMDYSKMSDSLNQLLGMGQNQMMNDAEIKLRSQQSEQIGIDNKLRTIELFYRGAEKQLELKERIANAAKAGLDVSMLREQLREIQISNQYLADYLGSRNRQAFNTEKLQELDMQSKELGNEYQRLQNEVFPNKNEAEMRLIFANIGTAMSQKLLNKSLSAQATAQAVLADIQAAGVKIDNNQKQQLMPTLVKTAELAKAQAALNVGIAAKELESVTLGPVKISLPHSARNAASKAKAWVKRATKATRDKNKGLGKYDMTQPRNH